MARGTIFGIFAHLMIKGGLSKITQAYEVISKKYFLVEVTIWNIMFIGQDEIDIQL